MSTERVAYVADANAPPKRSMLDGSLAPVTDPNPRDIRTAEDEAAIRGADPFRGAVLEMPHDGSQTLQPPQPPVEFYALDRFHASTRMTQMVGVASDVVKAVVAELEKLTHMGPVHVILAREIKSDSYPAAGTGDVVGDGFAVRPFVFTKV